MTRAGGSAHPLIVGEDGTWRMDRRCALPALQVFNKNSAP
jgi:hypothetical protein